MSQQGPSKRARVSGDVIAIANRRLPGLEEAEAWAHRAWEGKVVNLFASIFSPGYTRGGRKDEVWGCKELVSTLGPKGKLGLLSKVVDVDRCMRKHGYGRAPCIGGAGGGMPARQYTFDYVVLTLLREFDLSTLEWNISSPVAVDTAQRPRNDVHGIEGDLCLRTLYTNQERKLYVGVLQEQSFLPREASSLEYNGSCVVDCITSSLGRLTAWTQKVFIRVNNAALPVMVDSLEPEKGRFEFEAGQDFLDTALPIKDLVSLVRTYCTSSP